MNSAVAEQLPEVNETPEGRTPEGRTPDGRTPGVDDNAVRQFVTFRVGGDVFGVDMVPVQEIIRLPGLVRVPLGPPALLGLSNLRGSVLPVVSLRRVFGLPDQDADDATRVLVINLGTPMGFVVDQVQRVMGVAADRIEDTAAIQSTVDAELLSGIIKEDAHRGMVMIVDFARVLGEQFSQMELKAAATGMAASLRAHARETPDEDGAEPLQLVSFGVADQEYGIPIQRVKEIVQVPEHRVSVPHAAGYVLGLISLRNRLLPLISLRRIFGLDDEPLAEHHRIVVVSPEGGRSLQARSLVGLVVDTVNQVLRVDRSLVEELPALLNRDDDMAEIQSICRLDQGRRLVSVLAARRLMARQGVRDALDSAAELQETDLPADDEGSNVEDDDKQVVVFRLDQDEFGVAIESVKEIVRVPDSLSKVPKAPHFIEGVINLRGGVLPVVDQRRRFGLADLDRNDRQRIIVFDIQGVRTGFIVDHVSEVRRLPAACIEPAPRLSAEQGRLIRQVANLEQDKRMIMLLDVDQMLSDTELTAVARVG